MIPYDQSARIPCGGTGIWLFMPFITEEIWQQIRAPLDLDGDSIMIQPYSYNEQTKVQDAIAEIEWVKAVLLGVRKIRADMNIAPGIRLTLLLQNTSEADMAILNTQRKRLEILGRLAEIRPVNGEAPESATFVVGRMHALIPLAGMIDQKSELARLNKEMDRLKKISRALKEQLDNKKFIAKAPQALVQKNHLQLQKNLNSLATLEVQREKIAII